MAAQNDASYNGLSYAAWGYFFLNFDFKLGTVTILPNFVGFLLFLSAISLLSKERRELTLLRPLCALLAVWNIIGWPLSWYGVELSGRFLFLDLLVAAAELYFHFQFLTDMAALAEQYQPRNVELDRQIRCRRAVYVVLITAVTLYMPHVKELPSFLGVVMILVLIILAIVSFMIMWALFRLRRYYREGGYN